MKKLIYPMLAAALLTGCQSEPRANITGRIDGIESDSLLVMYGNYGERTSQQRDTIAMKNGEFAFNLQSDHIQEIHIWELPKTTAEGKRAINSRSIALPILPHAEVRMEGSMTNYTLSGDSFYTEFQAFRSSLRPIEQKMEEVMEEVKHLQREKAPQPVIMNAYNPIRQLSLDKADMTFNYIKANPDSDVSVCLLATVSMKQAKEALALITPRAQQGKMNAVYQNVKARIEREAQRVEAMKTIKEGVTAPDFTIKTLKGEPLKLSDLRGKYLVLDFWGTWCGWCIKGMPQMKATYAKYSDKIEFLGIACNDTEEKWKAKIEELQLPWIHALNSTDNDLSVLYGVSGYPTKFIIDKEGKILKKVGGESPEFYTFIDELMK